MTLQAGIRGLLPVKLVARLAGFLGGQARLFLSGGPFMANVAGKLRILDVILVVEHEVGLLGLAVQIGRYQSQQKRDHARGEAASGRQERCCFLSVCHIQP